MLAAHQLRRSYGAGRGLDGVDLTVAAGEIYGLLGPNGAGKTSLVRALTGRLRLDGGTVAVAGRDPRSDPAARRALGLVPQEIALYQDLTVAENLGLLGELAGLSRAAAAAAVPPALAWIDLADRGDSRVATLSGGQKRRVNLAAATLHQPAVLIL
ncbi:MAG: ABC transporter ATP-binding protein, partial [Gemmatimonadales bacterium]|nr:ABC transporter ATP-binding protein [Gemmatimonadales bacterium]